jgi:hypothetical protein
MTMMAKILNIVAPVEVGTFRGRLAPANDNDPKGPPPPAAAARIPDRAFGRRGAKCSAMISPL